MATFLNPRAMKTAYGEYPTVDVPEGWPAPHLIARKNDELGEQIIAYAKRWKDHSDFPPSPWDTRTGTISLIPPDQPRPETDPVPLYRLKEDAFLGALLYLKGDEVPFAGWPIRAFTVEAMNESAKRVLSYQTRYGAGRTLPGQPHQAGVLNLPNPATTFGTPQNYVHRGTIGELNPV
jgi:hypothetical protein